MDTAFPLVALVFVFLARLDDLLEDLHVKTLDIWLEPAISIADSYGFDPRELSNILRVVEDNRELR